MSPIVSVVIPVYNGSATIGDTLRSLQAQSGAPAFEVIVVDNGSTDATREVVSRFDVTLLDEVTRGPAAARNRGLRDARADIVAHCDADTVLTRRWLSELVEPLRDPGVAVADEPEEDADRGCIAYAAERVAGHRPDGRIRVAQADDELTHHRPSCPEQRQQA